MTEDNQEQPETRRLRFGLSGKLLVLTIMFVMIAVVLIYVPAIAIYRVNWLNDRLAAAHTAALVIEAAPGPSVPESLRRQILDSIGAKSVVLKIDQSRRLAGVRYPGAQRRTPATHGKSGFDTERLRYQNCRGCAIIKMIE